MTLDELNRRFGTESSIRFLSGQGDLPVCMLTNSRAKASVYLHGAHVASYEPVGEKPVIYMSPRSNFAPGKPIRGGVPVCFPWFGPKADDLGAPPHGFARTQPWTVIDAVQRGDAVTLSLRLSSNEELKKLWPHDFSATMRITLEDSLTIQLEITNESKEAFQFSEALHTYFSVSDVKSVTITGLEKARFASKVAGCEGKVTGEAIRFEGETDRVYLDTAETCVIHDPAWARKIEVSKSGSKSTVVWNPHTRKAASLPDLGEDTWPHFCCVESANALANVVTLAAGGVHAISQTIRVVKGQS